MNIKKILSQYRRDFRAIYECEHCGYAFEGEGYDDSYYHNHVVPGMVCEKCGKKADESYRPLKPKYSEDTII